MTSERFGAPPKNAERRPVNFGICRIVSSSGPNSSPRGPVDPKVAKLAEKYGVPEMAREPVGMLVGVSTGALESRDFIAAPR